MKRINDIDKHIDKLRPKIAAGGRDWTSSEKEAIEAAYFEITKVSTVRKKGRTLDLGCSSCIESAVNIIKNYIALIQDTDSAPEDGPIEWRKSVKTIEAYAKELGFKIPKKAKSKQDKIDAVETHIAEKITKENEDLLGSAELSEEDQKAQLVEIIKAKSGEEVDPADYTLEELQEFADEED